MHHCPSFWTLADPAHTTRPRPDVTSGWVTRRLTSTRSSPAITSREGRGARNGYSSIRASRPRCVLQRPLHVLDLEEFAESLFTALTTDPAEAGSTPRGVVTPTATAVDRDSARPNASCHGNRVGRWPPHVGVEPVLALVGDADRLVHITVRITTPTGANSSSCAISAVLSAPATSVGSTKNPSSRCAGRTPPVSTVVPCCTARSK